MPTVISKTSGMLESSKLIKGHHEISESGKATKYFEIKQIKIHLTPELLIELSKTIPISESNEVWIQSAYHNLPLPADKTIWFPHYT